MGYRESLREGRGWTVPDHCHRSDKGNEEGEGEGLKPHERHRKEAKADLHVRIVAIENGGLEESLRVAEAIIRKERRSIGGSKRISGGRESVLGEVKEFLKGGDDVLVILGGTGLGTEDVVIEATRPFFEKELGGFGELLRKLNYDRMGSAAVQLRATAGIAKGKLIVCAPESPDAFEAPLRLFSEEFPHILFVARRATHR